MASFGLINIIFLLVLCGCLEQESDTAVFFCPQDSCENRVIFAIQEAESSIDAAVYSFTSEEIFSALKSAKERGVKVRFVGDYLQASSLKSKTNDIDGRIFWNSTMHHKFMVVDEKTVLTGSFNWTTNADEKNAENLVFLFDEKIAKEFEKEFLKLWVLSS